MDLRVETAVPLFLIQQLKQLAAVEVELLMVMDKMVDLEEVLVMDIMEQIRVELHLHLDKEMQVAVRRAMVLSHYTLQVEVVLVKQEDLLQLLLMEMVEMGHLVV
tara:strand:+ start:354 stop:668 length:315 start_codon:yes stop_codon:yes gene_type:complete